MIASEDTKLRRCMVRRERAWLRYLKTKCQLGNIERAIAWVIAWDKAYHNRDLQLRSRRD